LKQTIRICDHLNIRYVKSSNQLTYGVTYTWLVQTSTDKPKAELDKLRGKAESLLKDTRERLSDTGDKIAYQTKEIAGKADDYVHEKPWTGVGIGAAVGVVIGVLLARR